MAELTPQIERICAEGSMHSWHVAVIPANPEATDITVNYNGEQLIAAASLTKLAVARSVIINGIPLDTPISLEPQDRREEPDILHYFPDGHTMEVGVLLERMLVNGSITATRMLVRKQGGPQKINEMNAVTYPTTLLKPVEKEGYPIASPEAAFNFGSTSALEAAGLLRELLQNPPVNAILRRSTFDCALRGNLRDQEPSHPPKMPIDTTANRLIARSIGHRMPHAIADYLLKRTTPHGSTRFPNKEGSMNDEEKQHENVRHDVALIGDYVIAAGSVNLTTKDAPFGRYNSAHITHRRLGVAVYHYSHT